MLHVALTNYLALDAKPDPGVFTSTAVTIPIEQSITYKDYSGTVVKSVTKAWDDPYQLACELDSLDSSGLNGVFYTYGSDSVITDKKEYDYGQISGAAECSQAQLTAPSVTPRRETSTVYHFFPATSIFPSEPSIFDRPDSVTVNGNGSEAAQTTYSYDGNANALSKTQKCLYNVSVKGGTCSGRSVLLTNSLHPWRDVLGVQGRPRYSEGHEVS